MNATKTAFMTEKERVLKKVDELIEQAKHLKPAPPASKPDRKLAYNSLAEHIKTQEQADFLRFMLKFI